MASSMSMVVLCPYGRRQTVKVTPNTSILEILEQACHKQGINPTEYDITHYSRRLDLSLSVRFANLPNNCMLELCPAKHIRHEATVTVCVQLESGERLVDEFLPSSTIEDILQKCLDSNENCLKESQPANTEPVCVYMQQKFTGDQLKETTLRSLGLTGGRAIIRLMYRDMSSVNCQAHVSQPLTKPPEIAHPAVEHNILIENHSSCSVPKQPRMELQNTISSSIGATDRQLRPRKSPRLMGAGTSGMCTNAPTTSFEHISAPEPMQFEDATMSSEEIVVIQDVARSDNSMEVVEEEEKEIGEIKYLGPRNAVLFNLEDIADVKKADFPDEFFELDINDVRYLFKEYTRTRCQLENQPLMLKSQREKLLLQQLSSYKQTIIRVYFPERLVLQGTFIVEETVKVVMDFVRNFLKDQNTNFYLYTTPPKTLLQPENTLLEARLVPAVIIYFGSNDQKKSYLRRDIVSQVSDPRAVGLAAARLRKQNMPELSSALPYAVSTEEISPEVQQLSAANSLLNSTPKFDATTNSKAPKWFKSGKK